MSSPAVSHMETSKASTVTDSSLDSRCLGITLKLVTQSPSSRCVIKVDPRGCVTLRSAPCLPACLLQRRAAVRSHWVKVFGPSVTTSCRLQMDYETKVFPHTGGYGRYNRIVVVFSWFPSFAVTLNLFSDVFYTLIPDSYHCKPDPTLLPSAFLLSNFSTQGYLNLTIPWVNGSGRSHCELYKYPPNSSDLSENAPRERVPCTTGWEYSHVAGLQSNSVTEVRRTFSPGVNIQICGGVRRQRYNRLWVWVTFSYPVKPFPFTCSFLALFRWAALSA